MKKIAVFLRPGDVLKPGGERVVNIRPAGSGALFLEVVPPGKTRPVHWRVDTRHQFLVEETAT